MLLQGRPSFLARAEIYGFVIHLAALLRLITFNRREKLVRAVLSLLLCVEIASPIYLAAVSVFHHIRGAELFNLLPSQITEELDVLICFY